MHPLKASPKNQGLLRNEGMPSLGHEEAVGAVRSCWPLIATGNLVLHTTPLPGYKPPQIIKSTGWGHQRTSERDWK